MLAHLGKKKQIWFLALTASVSFLLPLTAQIAKANEPSALEIKAAELVIEEALINTLENSTWSNGSAFKDAIKNLDKYKSKNKAMAFCANWKTEIANAMNGKTTLRLEDAGRSWNYTSKLDAKNKAIEWCEKGKRKRSQECDCEVVFLNTYSTSSS